MFIYSSVWVLGLYLNISDNILDNVLGGFATVQLSYTPMCNFIIVINWFGREWINTILFVLYKSIHKGVSILL